MSSNSDEYVNNTRSKYLDDNHVVFSLLILINKNCTIDATEVSPNENFEDVVRRVRLIEHSQERRPLSNAVRYKLAFLASSNALIVSLIGTSAFAKKISI